MVLIGLVGILLVGWWVVRRGGVPGGSFFGLSGELPPSVSLEVGGPKEDRIVDRVDPGETLSHVFARHGLSPETLARMVRASKDVYDLNRVRPGSEVVLTVGEAGQVVELEYAVNLDLRILVERDSIGFAVRRQETPFERRMNVVSGRVYRSLFEDMLAAGANPELADRVADIFGWQIDFFRDLRPGDRFDVVYGGMVRPDGTWKLGEIEGARVISRGRAFWAIRYGTEGGRTDYFDLGGRSLRRQFLKSPLRYRRISSRFTSRRYHPILKTYRPHYGVDYAAPYGTPVVAVGEGTVVKREWNGGFGRYIEIRHNGTYRTGYAHLSRFGPGIAIGRRVVQGRVIGYVGSSGLASGPHVDFRILRNGRYVNPLTADLPAAPPVPRAELNRYREAVIPVARLIGRAPVGTPLAGGDLGGQTAVE